MLNKWGGEGAVLRQCIKKWEEGAAAQWTWGTQQQRETETQRWSIMQLPCRLQCTLSGPGGRRRESSRETDTVKEQNRVHHNRIEPREFNLNKPPQRESFSGLSMQGAKACGASKITRAPPWCSSITGMDECDLTTTTHTTVTQYYIATWGFHKGKNAIKERCEYVWNRCAPAAAGVLTLTHQLRGSNWSRHWLYEAAGSLIHFSKTPLHVWASLVCIHVVVY